MRYKCVVELVLDDYDEDGFATGGWFVIPLGSIWEVDDESPKIIGNDDTIRLVSESKWIEILGSTLSAHFEEIKKVKTVDKMTIDEAIAHERERAEELRHHYDRFANLEAKEHEQIAELLEELKELREKAECERCVYNCGCHEELAYKSGYNKAIDEAMDESAKAICVGCAYLDGTKCTYTGCNCGVSKPMLASVMKALEQLKEGGENE